MAKRKNDKPVTFEMLTDFYAEFIKPQFYKINLRFEKMDKKMDKGFAEAKRERREIKTELRYVKDEVKGIKADLSDTPTRKEFDQLERKVEIIQTS